MAVMNIEYYSKVLDMEWGVTVLHPDASRVTEPDCTDILSFIFCTECQETKIAGSNVPMSNACCVEPISLLSCPIQIMAGTQILSMAITTIQL